MTETDPLRSGLAGATEQTADIKGKIVEFSWYLKKKGRKGLTIEQVGRRLNQLVHNGVNLLNPEEVKGFIARQERWKNRTKAIDVSIYDGFLKFLRIPWDKPEYKIETKPKFIPNEEEIDQLISGAGKRLSVFLQLLKETAMRYGEAAQIRWNDIDLQRKLKR